MNKRLATIAIPLLVTAATLPSSSDTAPLFPEAKDLEPALKMPSGASFGIGPDGNFLVDGKPRFLLGTIYYLAFSDTQPLRPGPGYPQEHAWIYESPPTRDYLQRLGFDSAGGEVSTSWMRKYRPEPGFRRADRLVDWSLATNFWHSGLPVILDFTAAVWSHGGIPYQKGREPAERAFVGDAARESHMISYSLVTEEGRDVWRSFWRSGVEELQAHGAKPFAYELFNEPCYDDRSPAAREAFAAFLSDKFGGDPSAMDEAWGTSFGSFAAAAAFEKTGVSVGLGVEWLKFREKAFEDGVLLGVETIRELDPDARFCFQPLDRDNDVDRVIGAEKHCQIVMTQTGGDNLWRNMRLMAVADGKPLIDGETYFRNTRASHRGKLLRHYAMGLNATYYFKWERRLDEVRPFNEDGLKRVFERYPWLGLNPGGTPPEALAGMMDGKRDIAAVEELFGPREHGVKLAERVAVLASRPTSRLGEAAGLRSHAWSGEAATALVRGAHLPTDAILEEQLPDGRLDRYRFLVAAGIAATYPETPPAIRGWVERGGTLLLAQEAMQLDEYAREAPGAASFPGITLGDEIGGEAQELSFRGMTLEAVPYRSAAFAEGWRVIASLADGTPAIAEREIGRGRVVFIGVRFPNAGDQARLMASFAAEAGVLPTSSALDAASGAPTEDIEVFAARGAGGATAFIIDNRGLAPRAVRFRPGEAFDAPALADVSRRVVLGRDSDGFAMLLLEPGVPAVLLGAPSRDAIAKALSSAPRAWNEGAAAWAAPDSGGHAIPPASAHHPDSQELPIEPYGEVAGNARAWLAARATETTVGAKAFRVDPSRVKFLDLRDAANVPYGDKIADDGKGGWTDQGENCMENAPWGVTDCNGVPFDFIRPDHNGERAAVVLRSTRQPYLPEAVRGIRADLRAKALYFLHAGAFLEAGREAFRYVVHYGDGSSLTLPMRGFIEFDDWWMHGVVPGGRDAMPCKPGWLNAKSRGFHILRWENPFPEKTIAAIDIESACTKTAPIIEAITAELPDEPAMAALPLVGMPRLRPWGGAQASAGPHDGGTATGAIASISFASARAWAGCGVAYHETAAMPAAARRADLEFLLSTPGTLPLPPLQLRVGTHGGYTPISSFSSETGMPGTWRVSFPLDLAADGLHAPIGEFALQLCGERPEGTSADISVSSARVLAYGEPENALSLRRLLPLGHHGVGIAWRDGGVELTVDDRTEAWGHARLDPVRPVAIPENAESAVFAFDANGGRTALGRRDRGRHRFRIRLECVLADGSRAEGPWVRDPPVDGGAIDEDPNSWQAVRIPLAKLLPDGAVALARVKIQFTGLPDTGRAGLIVRDFRFENHEQIPASQE